MFSNTISPICSHLLVFLCQCVVPLHVVLIFNIRRDLLQTFFLLNCSHSFNPKLHLHSDTNLMNPICLFFSPPPFFFFSGQFLFDVWPLPLIPGDSGCFTVCLPSCSRAHAACVTVTLIAGSTVRGFGTKPLQAHRACM